MNFLFIMQSNNSIVNMYTIIREIITIDNSYNEIWGFLLLNIYIRYINILDLNLSNPL